MGSKMVFFSRSWYQNGTKTWFGYGLDMSKMVFFSSTDIKMGLRLGLDMSKTVFFSSTGIRMGLRLGLNMVLGV